MGRRKRWPDLLNITSFDKGVLYAAGWLIQAHDQPTIALELLETYGFDKELLRKNRDQFDQTEREQFKKAGFFKKGN